MSRRSARPDGEVVTGGRSPWFRRAVVLLSTSLVLGILLIAGGAFAFWSVFSDADIPDPDQLAIPDPTLIRDRDGEYLAPIQPAAIRRNVDLERLPEHVAQAVIAAEDRAFYEHQGISPRGILRAAWANVSRGERVQGASTIPQQYVELAITDIPDTYVGKFREAATAVRLDRELSKDRILENYLNAVPWGRQAYGIEAASRTYFDQSSYRLDLHQAAVLAGMIAAPTAFDPARNPEGAAARRDFVLEGMVLTGAITRAEADELIGADLPPLRDRPLADLGNESYFLDAVERETLGILGELDDDRDPTVGLTVHTTYDRRAQEIAGTVANEQLAETGHTASIVTIDNDTGAVRALLGGLDYRQQQYNVAIERQSLRSPGSAFKTFALTAFVQDGWDPDATRIDGPDEYVLEVEGQDDYEPGNFGGQSYRNITVREATVRSVNTAYVELSDAIGFERVTDTATALGVDTELNAVPSAVLGSQGVTPLEMAEAYATLGNEGVHNEPHVVTRIETHDGEVLFEHEPAGEEVVDPNTAAVVTDVLTDVVESGTATAAATRHPVAGKTGTTNRNVDAWFVGYTPDVTTAVWVGNLDNSAMPDVTGGSYPATIFGAYVDQLVGDLEPGSFPEPDFSGLERFTEVTRTAPPPPPPPPAPEPTETETEEPEEDEPEEPEETEEPEEPEEPEAPEAPEPPPAPEPPTDDGAGADDGGGEGGGEGGGGQEGGGEAGSASTGDEEDP